VQEYCKGCAIIRKVIKNSVLLKGCEIVLEWMVQIRPFGQNYLHKKQAGVVNISASL
jgi:hypothetical protein